MFSESTPTIDIAIEGNKAIVRTKDSNSGATTERVLYTKDLFESMAQLVENTKERSGPVYNTYGTDYSAVRYWEETKSGYLVMVCEASPSLRTFSMNNIHSDYMTGVAKTCPLKVKPDHTLITKIHWPYTIMATVFQKSGGNWIARNGYMGWSDSAITDVNNTKLYGFPLPNLYNRDYKLPYRICWGQVSAFVKCDHLEVAQLIPIFYDSFFNMDLVEPHWIRDVLSVLCYEVAVKDTSLVNGRITEAYLKTKGDSIKLTRTTLAEGLKEIRGSR